MNLGNTIVRGILQLSNIKGNVIRSSINGVLKNLDIDANKINLNAPVTVTNNKVTTLTGNVSLSNGAVVVNNHTMSFGNGSGNDIIYGTGNPPSGAREGQIYFKIVS